jgi:hypothetical protein
MFRVVSATRHGEHSFNHETMLGRCLNIAYKNYPIKKSIYYHNSQGLPKCYNKAVTEPFEAEEILIFIHDDIFICDFFWLDKVFGGLTTFDVVGLAGNKRRIARQPSWAFKELRVDAGFVWDDPSNLSGIVGHGESFPCDLSIFGNVFQQCVLLDGLFIAAKRKMFLDNKILFDETFDFHFYDMDLCRQLEEKKLRAGTIPLSVIHKSGGNFGSVGWNEGYKKYLDKWKE